MGQIIIRNLEDDIVVGLKQRASLEGKSLEQLMREIARAALPLVGPARAALVRRQHAMQSAPLKTSSLGVIAAGRRERDAGL